jgi:cytochrome c oxidase subunit IV
MVVMIVMVKVLLMVIVILMVERAYFNLHGQLRFTVAGHPRSTQIRA